MSGAAHRGDAPCPHAVRHRFARTLGRIIVILGVAAAGCLVATPTASAATTELAASAAASNLPRTRGFVDYQPVAADVRCDGGTPTALAISFHWDARGLHDSEYAANVALALGTDDSSTPSRIAVKGSIRRASVPIAPGRQGTYQHTFSLPSNALGKVAVVQVFPAANHDVFRYAYNSVRIADLSCGSIAAPTPPTITMSPVQCDGTYTVTIDASDTTENWSGTRLLGGRHGVIAGVPKGHTVPLSGKITWTMLNGFRPPHDVISLHTGDDDSLYYSVDLASFAPKYPSGCDRTFAGANRATPICGSSGGDTYQTVKLDAAWWNDDLGSRKPYLATISQGSGSDSPRATLPLTATDAAGQIVLDDQATVDAGRDGFRPGDLSVTIRDPKSGSTVVTATVRLSNACSRPPSGSACSSAPFRDVATGSTFCRDIAWLTNRGISQGYPNGTFRPRTTVSRQSMAAFLYRAVFPHHALPGCTSSAFADVPTASPFCGAIAWLARSGISQGYSNGTFGPRNAVSRQSMAAFLYRMQHLGNAALPSCTSGAFADVPASSGFCGAIGWLAAQGVTDGYRDGGFHPRATVSRQSMAAFLHRL